MDMSSKLSVITLNNEGVAMIMDGRHEQASQMFTAALRCMAMTEEGFYQEREEHRISDRTVYCVHDDHKVLSVPSFRSQTTSPPSPQVQSSYTTSRRNTSTCFEEDDDDENNTTINVFMLPIVVVDENLGGSEEPRRTNLATPTSQRGVGGVRSSNHRSYRSPRLQSCCYTKTRLDFVIVYNLALSYHLFALSCSSRTTPPIEMLSIAATLYERAYRMLMEESEVVVVARVMVVLSNLGQIHQRLNDEASASACFQRLLTTMLVIRQQGASSRIEHWESFWSNVSGLIRPTHSSSSKKNLPAAAA